MFFAKKQKKNLYTIAKLSANELLRSDRGGVKEFRRPFFLYIIMK